MARCLLALGSNLGDRQAILDRACAEIAAVSGCQVLARSRWHGTAPIGGAEGQGAFLNGALLIETTLPPAKVATEMQRIETQLGRQRVVRWDARVIDIDLLLYEQEIIDTRELVVPHPRMGFRLFVLEPAVEIAGEMLHPTSGWTLSELLGHLQKSPRYVAIAATEKPIADWLAAQLQQRLGCSLASQGIETITTNCFFSTSQSVRMPAAGSTQSPVLATGCLNALGVLCLATLAQQEKPRPALVVAVDSAAPGSLRAVAAAEGFAFASKLFAPAKREDWRGLGPLARITASDPTTVVQEAVAALRCVWPDLSVSND